MVVTRKAVTGLTAFEAVKAIMDEDMVEVGDVSIQHQMKLQLLWHQPEKVEKVLEKVSAEGGILLVETENPSLVLSFADFDDDIHYVDLVEYFEVLED